MREQFDYTHLAGEWRVGQELLREKKAPGGQPYQQSTRVSEEQVADRAPTLAEKVGNRSYALRLETIAPLPIEALNSASHLHRVHPQYAPDDGRIGFVQATYERI